METFTRLKVSAVKIFFEQESTHDQIFALFYSVGAILIQKKKKRTVGLEPKTAAYKNQFLLYPWSITFPCCCASLGTSALGWFS